MSSPHDPQPQWPPPDQPPPYQYGGYPGPQPYGGYQPPQHAGYQAPQYGGWPEQQPAGPPRRPGVLTTAGVLWLLNGAFLLLLGGVALIANQLPGVEEVYAENPDVTPEMVQIFGLVTTPIAIAMIGLAIMVFTGATWARILVTVIGAPVALLGIALVVVPLLTIVAIVLQFLPASNAYAAARRRHA